MPRIYAVLTRCWHHMKMDKIMNKKKINYPELIVSIPVAYMLSILWYTYVFYVQNVGENYKSYPLTQVAAKIAGTEECLILGAVFIAIGIVICLWGEQVGGFLYKFRYPIALILFVVCVYLELNGSSIAMWDGILNIEDKSTILGTARAIRTDEWAVATPMMLSQYHNPNGAFAYYNSALRAIDTDVFLVYGQAVASWKVIFRPFYIGYLFLSPEKGLAFFWCGRYIALFLASFEFGMLITKKKKGLSALYATIILLSPLVQWWFAINGLVEMLVFAQVSIVLLWIYMRTEKVWLRFLCILGIMLCGGGFVFTLYPAWQIPVFYLILASIAWVVWENHAVCKMRAIDWIMAVTGILIFAGLMAVILYEGRETIELVMNSAYPGKRIGTGGGYGSSAMLYAVNMWDVLFGGLGFFENAAEDAQFFSFIPVCYIPPFLLWFREKKHDFFTGILAVICLVFGAYVIVGFPEILAKITLLSYSIDKRTLVILELIGIVLMIRSMAFLEKPLNRIVSIILAGGSAALLLYKCGLMNPEYMTQEVMIITAIILFLLFYSLLRYQKRSASKVFAVSTVAVMVLCGGLVNPIRQGIGGIYESTVLQSMMEIHGQDEDAIWVSVGERLPQVNVPIMAGIPTINSTNTYMSENWEKVDPAGDYERLYNRYANFCFVLKEFGRTTFIGKAADEVEVHLTLDDMKKLGVEYIWAAQDLTRYETDRYKIEIVEQIDQYWIYQVVEKG